MNMLLALYLFVVGLCLGSFALAMVDRMKSARDWVKGRSECEKCKTKLKTVDLIPVASWVSTGGRCRYCRTKLTAYYPLIEILTGVSFAVSYIFWPVELVGFFAVAQFLVWLFALVLMIALVVFDLRWYLLPNRLVYPLIYSSIGWVLLEVGRTGIEPYYIIRLMLAVLVSSGIFGFLYYVSKGKWIGDGDIRLGVAIGLFVGSPVNSWLVLFISSVLGVLATLILSIFSGKKNISKMKIPFGPYLILSLYIVVIFGSSIIDWYTTKILFL